MKEVSQITWGFYMALRNSLRTIDLARAAEISVQQVRNYEALGLLPAFLQIRIDQSLLEVGLILQP